MNGVKQFDHVGITVADLDLATAFFAGLGLEVEGRMSMQGEFVDTVIGIPDSRSEIVMLRPPNGGTGWSCRAYAPAAHARIARGDVHRTGPAKCRVRGGRPRLGRSSGWLRMVTAGGVGQYENIWRMAYVRGPEGIIVALAERIG